MSEKHSSIILIREIQSIEEKMLNQELKELDITIAQTKALEILLHYAEKQATLKEIEKSLGLAQSVVAGLIVRLEQKGYVKSFGNAADKRIKIVRITPLGEQQFEQSQYILGSLEKRVLSDLSENEIEQLTSLLGRIRKTLQAKI